MTFLIETKQREPLHDFTWELIQAKAYNDWAGHGSFDIRRIDDPKDFEDIPFPDEDESVPVGSIEFVSRFMQIHYPERVSSLCPLNVPEELRRYAGRDVWDIYSPEEADQLVPGKYFVKDMGSLKHPGNGIVFYDGKDPDILVGKQVSSIVQMDSEWRVFVFHDQMLWLSNYAGDPLCFPDREKVLEIVNAFKPFSPAAYTLDIFVNSEGTAIVECHRFFSCGLYGFSDRARYPFMLSQAWFELRTGVSAK